MPRQLSLDSIFKRKQPAPAPDSEEGEADNPAIHPSPEQLITDPTDATSEERHLVASTQLTFAG